MRLSYRPPFDWSALLAFLAPRAIPGLERVADGVYHRVIDGRTISVRHDEAGAALVVTGRAPAAPLRRLFDLDADPDAIRARLGAASGVVGRSVRARPGVRVPGAFDPFQTAIRVFLGQQISVAGATTLAGRLVVDGRFPSPAELATREVTGVPRVRAAAIRAFAAAVAAGELTLTPADVLLGRPGVGPWTAGAIAMRWGDPDAFPDGDLVLRKASGAQNAADLRRRAERWRPYRAYACMHVWLGKLQEHT